MLRVTWHSDRESAQHKRAHLKHLREQAQREIDTATGKLKLFKARHPDLVAQGRRQLAEAKAELAALKALTID